MHCPSTPIGYSKNYYPIIMILHSWNNLILICDKVVCQQILLCLVRWFGVYLILKPTMLHIAGHQSQLVIDILNSFFRAQFFGSIQWCSELFWFVFSPDYFTTWFLQSIFMSFFDMLSDLPNILTAGVFRFKIHVCLSELILMLREYIGLNFFTALSPLLLMLLLVIVFFLVCLRKNHLILVLMLLTVPHLYTYWNST